MKNYHTTALAIVSLFWVSCASTPQKRIDKNPAKFSSLSPDEQLLVEEGRIEQ